MRTALYLALCTPLLAGCLGPAPWADWDKGYTMASNRAASAAPWSDWEKGAATGAEASDSSFTPPDAVTYKPRAEVQTLAAEPITGPPPARARSDASLSMGGPYAPLDENAEENASANVSSQPLRLRGSDAVRTLPLVMTGTGEKAR
jgi:hypothetical protein